MSIEFHDEVTKLQSIIERFSNSKVANIDYRVRYTEDYNRYVRVVFNLSELEALDVFAIDFEKMSTSIHHYLSSEYYTLTHVAPKSYTDYGTYKRGRFAQKVAVVVKFYV